MSSYTPDIASLLRRGTSSESTSRPKVLVVAQPQVTGYSSLPGTRKEADNISDLLTTSCTLLEGSAGTKGAVLEQMATHAYVHLACHGEQDPADPLQSAFVLADGKLTLEMLMARTSSVAELAFLSACETATGDEKVPDEAVHLAAGMMAVGYRSVIATMWSIADNHAPDVAKEFYTTLLEQHDAEGKTDPARALHKAVAALRKREDIGGDQLVSWVPFVHFGV